MGDERDQDVQRAPLWPPDPEPTSADARPPEPGRFAGTGAPQPVNPPQNPPQNPWGAEPWGQWGAPASADAPDQFAPPSPASPQYPQYPQYGYDAPQPEQPRNPWQAAAVPQDEPPRAPAVDDAPTMRVSAAPAPSISDEQTMRVSAAPAPFAPETPGQTRHTDGGFTPAPRLEVADAPTQRYTAPPANEPPGAAAPASSAAPDAATTVASADVSAPPAKPPSETPSAKERKRLALAWRLGLTLAVSALLLAGAGGLYAYASTLAAEPQKVLASYCAAIKHDDYHTAYGLLSSSAQSQESETQYLADASARDTIEGPVTQCSGSPTQALSPLSFLRSPRSLIFNAQITRKQPASGQIALTRDATGWHVAALSSTLQGVDLGPLSTEQALCKAFGQHAYDQAYALLSTPYQKEQGDASTFARAFGSTLTVSGCAPDLKTYSVNSADQQASMDATLAVSIAGNGASPSSFTLPARLTFVREATGWRVDAITPLLNQ